MAKLNSEAIATYFGLCGLPTPELEFKFHPSRKWKFDFAWQDAKLALECEGGVWTGGRHTRGAGFMKDILKYNEAALLGWRVLRCTPSDLQSGEAVVLVKRFFESVEVRQ